MARTLTKIFRDTVATRGGRSAVQFREQGTWRSLSWLELAAKGDIVAAGLIGLGIEKGDRISILGNTCLEWILADLGVMMSGAATVTIYQSNTASECAYIISNSESTIVFAEDQEQVDKLKSIRDDIPSVQKVIVFTGKGDGEWVVSLDEVMAQGEAALAADANLVTKREELITSDDLICLIYTSGTTGLPKGVVLTHENMGYEAESVENVRILSEEDVQLLFLPLAHVFAQVLKAAWIATGHQLALTSMDTLLDDMVEVRPTLMASVPRLFEKVYTGVVGKVRSATGLKGALGNWALDVGDEMAQRCIDGGTPGGLKWSLAKRLVFSKIAATLDEKFGGRLRFFVSGGAPLSPRIAYFFQFADVEILEGYGMTESTAATCVNRSGEGRIGTVGPVLPGTQVKIAEDGEICIKGPGVMKEYWRLPEQTAETIKDGWLHTGDIGVFDDGYLKITGRKKELIVTAGGKNVAPAKIEGLLAANQYIAHAVVHGDKRKYLSALVTLDPENLETWAGDQGLAFDDLKQASKDPKVVALVQSVFDSVNSGLARYETIKKFRVLPVEFELGDELTPTLKVKRNVVEKKFSEDIDSMYDGESF
ncbi:MAG: AMP-dependent synthetase [Myxococcales bacterium]|nr:AMP-dependent synthetase [Myxococcales bacterium]